MSYDDQFWQVMVSESRNARASSCGERAHLNLGQSKARSLATLVEVSPPARVPPIAPTNKPHSSFAFRLSSAFYLRLDVPRSDNSIFGA